MVNSGCTSGVWRGGRLPASPASLARHRPCRPPRVRTEGLGASAMLQVLLAPHALPRLWSWRPARLRGAASLQGTLPRALCVLSGRIQGARLLLSRVLLLRGGCPHRSDSGSGSPGLVARLTPMSVGFGWGEARQGPGGGPGDGRLEGLGSCSWATGAAGQF